MDEMPMISTLTMGQVKVKSEHLNTKFEKPTDPPHPLQGTPHVAITMIEMGRNS